MMDDEQQEGGLQLPETGNVMESVLGTFDGLADNATSLIGSSVSKIGETGSDLAAKAGELAGNITGNITDTITGGDTGNDAGSGASSDASSGQSMAGSLGETASGIAGSVGNSLSQGVDAAVNFARGLFGG